ncbi:MAG: ABC transporter permease, partial [Verrucomicrobiae bacterium]|nr:ABC transporter permease [Verrucomicrobiae bacterium]
MTFRTLLLRNLAYHWRSLLAVACGAAVGATVLTGSLIVGDSMRASLRDLTLDRLGGVDCALAAGRFFREQLAAEIGHHKSVRAAPAILLRGSAVHGTTGTRAGQVNVLGVDPRFWDLAVSPSDSWNAQDAIRNAKPDHVVLNETLARDLGARAGDDVLLRFENSSAVPRESVMG